MERLVRRPEEKSSRERANQKDRSALGGVPGLGHTWPPRLAKHQLEGRKCSLMGQKSGEMGSKALPHHRKAAHLLRKAESGGQGPRLQEFKPSSALTSCASARITPLLETSASSSLL